MKSKNSLFLRNNLIPFALILAILLVFSTCEKTHIWGIERQELKAMIAGGDFSFLSKIDFENGSYDEILEYAPGAAYYLARVMNELHYTEIAKKLLALEWERGSAPWKYEAGQELAAGLIADQRYDDAQKIITSFSQNYHSAYNIEKIERIKIDLLYWQEQDEELQKLLDEQSFSPPRQAWADTDPELILFKAVASYRLKRSDWADWFRTLFYQAPASDLHARAYTYLINDKQGLDYFAEYELEIFQAKSLAAQGKYKEAQALFKTGLARFPVTDLTDTRLVPDYGLACLRAGSPPAEAEFVQGLSMGLETKKKLLAWEMAAKINTANNSFKKAGEIWRQILEASDDVALKKRARWHILNNALKRGSYAALKELSRPGFDWSDPDFFTDLLDECLSALILTKDWDTVWQFYLVLKNTPPTEFRLKLSYLTARLISLGYLKGKAQELGKLTGELSQKDGYYAFLAAHFLHTPSLLPKWEKHSYPAGNSLSDKARVILGFFNFGLFKQGFERLYANIALFEPGTLSDLARELYERGQFLYAMRVLGLIKSRDQAPLFAEEVTISYPLAYKEEITEAAGIYGLDQYLFFALIRRESAFDNKVVSWAGAVGLTQLMPATAVDVAKRIGLRDMDLTDPRQNALLGAYFLKDLLKRFKNIPRALAAYNAGPSRVRSWENSIGGLPDDLYIEAIPILETRNFVKIVCTAALYYSFIYDNAKPPALKIKELFD